MWLAVAPRDVDAGDDEQVLPRLQAVLACAADLEACLRAGGVAGIGGALEVHRRLASVLDEVPVEEIERLQREIGRLADALREAARRLAGVRELKARLAR